MTRVMMFSISEPKKSLAVDFQSMTITADKLIINPGSSHHIKYDLSDMRKIIINDGDNKTTFEISHD